MVDTYRARRRLKMLPDVFREPGELVPEAHTWRAAESWLHTGYMTEAKDVDEDDFRDAVEEFCPDDAERIYELVGLTEGVDLVGPHKMPRRLEPAVVVELKPKRKAPAKKT